MDSESDPESRITPCEINSIKTVRQMKCVRSEVLVMRDWADMSHQQVEMSLQNISTSVYEGLCIKIGTPEIVDIRRTIVDVSDFFLNNEKIRRFGKRLESGSSREGFRLKGSDWDCMHWTRDSRVFWDFSQVHSSNRQTLILCDSSESPPGFTLLWLPKTVRSDLLPALVRINGKVHISSAKHRELTRTWIWPDSTIHGPCSSGDFTSAFGGRLPPMEYDNAHCFASDFWPPLAFPWIDRCHSWPPPYVVDDIIRSGCHFVAIGHKLGNHADNEWRISFSQAEYKLVYCMNHTQFLTYGLLKLFLKEIVHKDIREGKLLCSYHMKTTIFWVIQQNTTAHWCPQNLLACFWACFKLLLKWVYEGICPNFFIPENNMFLNNVHGLAQKKLFTWLYGLYEKGIAFLLQSPSIRSYILKVFNPILSVCTCNHALSFEAKEDCILFLEMSNNDSLVVLDLLACIDVLPTIERLLGSPLTRCQILMIQKSTGTLLRNVVFELQRIHACRSGTVNKNMYNVEKRLCHMLKLASKFGFASDILYLVMYYYRTLRCREALAVIGMAKEMFSVGFHIHAVQQDPLVYIMTISGLPWSFKIKRVVAIYLRLENKICFLKELTTEHRSASQNGRGHLSVPPYVLCHMLEFLCCRHVDPLRQQVVLDNLQALIQHNEGELIHFQLRDISWQILGICQQIAGNHQAALYSYQQSLKEIPYNRIQTATRERMDHLRSFH